MRSTTCDRVEKTSTRRAGVLLHPSSLPGPDGIGDLGAPARRFVEFLAHAGQAVWQVLPLAPTGYGDSPYQALSAFAGNPLLVSLEDLCQEGWLAEADWKGMPAFGTGEVDYPLVSRFKLGLLRRAADRFQALASPAEREALRTFREREAAWVEDLALFLVLKDRYQGAPWIAWDRALALRDPRAMEAARRDYAAEVSAQVFVQWVFDRQWSGLRAHACAHGISLMGDLPIYLAHDSAEVWARPWLFRLDPQGVPRAVAGVPPDYFSATGQLWGNPLYDWTAQASDGFTFWVERMRQTLRLYDLVRLDHFRGFEAYWEVPAGAPTAQDGKWVKGPGAAVFEAMEASLGHLPIVAENLGVITPEVEALRHRFGFPGMAILQFAFGKDPQADSFKPHNYGRDLVAYTGTHDNDTTLGWWASKAGAASIRTAEDIAAERAHAMAYLATDGSEMNWVLIRGVYASVADLAMAPLQDLLGLGSEARMNIPAVASGNWRWRCEEGALAPEVARRARALAQLYGRA